MAMQLQFHCDKVKGSIRFTHLSTSGSLFIRIAKDDGMQSMVFRLTDDQVSQLAEMLVAGLTNNGDRELKE